jgi:shikimate dehydrogenase
MITGTTKVFYMLAHPIAHVRTPEIINPTFCARGIDAIMVPVHYRPEDFALGWEVMKRTQNLGGIVVSVPHKELALRLADDVEDSARELGAANVIRRESDGRMVATNFDGLGFLRGMLGGGSDAAGRAILLVGAGGAGRAIAYSLARSGFESLRISDTDQTKATRLASEMSTRYPALQIRSGDNSLQNVEVLINATPCGLKHENDDLPVDTRDLRPGMLVADIVMKPRETPLLKAARAAGCEIRYGAGMLDTQIELMLAYFGY